MPTLTKDRSGSFFIVFSQAGKRVWKSLKTKDRRVAYQRFSTYELNPTPVSATLSKAQDDYMAYVRTNLSPKTFHVYENIFKSFRTFIGDRPIRDITMKDIEVYKTHRISSVSAATVNHELRGLRAFFNRHVEWATIPSNPCKGVKSIRIVDTTRPYLTETQLSKLLSHIKAIDLHDIVLLGAMTGMRRDEILNLRWTDVDRQRWTLVVQSSSTFRTKGGKIRVIPLNQSARAVFRSRPADSQYVFQTAEGGTYRGDYITKVFKKAIRACKLVDTLHFHSLRHTFASLLVQQGVSLYHVQRLMGHSSSRVTEIYAHLGGSELLSSVEKLMLPPSPGIAAAAALPTATTQIPIGGELQWATSRLN